MSDNNRPSTFQTDGPVDVTVLQTSGTTVLTASDTTEVKVDLHASGRDADDLIARTTVEYHAGSLRIEVPKSTGFFGRSASVDVRASVPNASTADVRSGSGHTELEGEFGTTAVAAGSGAVVVAACTEARVKTGSGDTTVHRCTDITADSGSGDIHVGHAEGRVEVQTGSGDVEIGGAVTSGRVTTASGDISISAVKGTVELRTASGDTTVQSAIHGELNTTAASGDAVIGIAAGTAAHLDVSAVSGQVQSGLEETDAPTAADRTLTLSARTVSGSITLSRAG